MYRCRSLTLAIALTGVVLSCGYVEAKPGPGSQSGTILPIPEYGDKSAWAVYVRRLQDTVAKRWYDEIFYYNYPSSISRGVVTLRYTFDPSGKVLSRTVISNTANKPFAARPFPPLPHTQIQPVP